MILWKLVWPGCMKPEPPSSLCAMARAFMPERDLHHLFSTCMMQMSSNSGWWFPFPQHPGSVRASTWIHQARRSCHQGQVLTLHELWDTGEPHSISQQHEPTWEQHLRTAIRCYQEKENRLVAERMLHLKQKSLVNSEDRSRPLDRVARNGPGPVTTGESWVQLGNHNAFWDILGHCGLREHARTARTELEVV